MLTPVKLCRVFTEQLDAAIATMPTRKSLEDAVHYGGAPGVFI